MSDAENIPGLGDLLKAAEAKAQEGLVGTEIKNIEFENPVTMYEGDQLRCLFTFTPEGVTCDIVLKTADGQHIVVGEDVQDIIESGPNEPT